MWSDRHTEPWQDLDAVAEPPDMGRRLDAGGFALAEPFDRLLRQLSADYLRDAWTHLAAVLRQHGVEPGSLSWGWFHPGETGISGITTSEPHQFVGWTSRELAYFYTEPRFAQMDDELKQMTPMLRCAASWRSLKWRIAPDDYPMALRLIEALCTDELSDWSPAWVLEHHAETEEPWVKVSKALYNRDEHQVRNALAEARAVYTPLGYRIMRRAYAGAAESQPYRAYLTEEEPVEDGGGIEG
jgi:hypothetical protein